MRLNLGIRSDQLSGDRHGIDREVRLRLRRSIRQLRPSLAEASISLQELRCDEPNCPDVETVVLIGRGKSQTVQYKIEKPAAEVTCEDLDRVLER